ncbi:MAG: hypothetical protein R3C59_15305 [Planctomycetaceae bacterium]
MEHQQYIFVNVDSTQWLLYVAVLLIAVFFRFSRLLAVRNLDLLLLLTLSTALVVSAANRPNDADATQISQTSAEEADQAGTAAVIEHTAVAEPASVPISPLYRWSTILVLTLSVGVVIRLMFDESLTRRPRLEQNLNQSGLTFLLIPAFSILMTGVFIKEPPRDNTLAVEAGVALLEQKESASGDSAVQHTPAPTETILAATATKMAELSGRVNSLRSELHNDRSPVEAFIARVLVVLAHSTVVMGLLYIGRRHFSSVQLGISMSCLYLLLPCTAYNVHELSHVLPGACLTWAFASYRKPAVAGILLGLACGTLFFAVFLLPLWAVFYGRKGSLKFGLSLGAVAAVVLLTFALTSESTDSFVNKLVMTANWTAYRLFDAASPLPEHAIGQVYLRITLAALFLVMLIAMTVIPRKRNLENLLANSTALIVAAQLWYPDDVGSYVLWYLPLLLLVVFRPRLDRFVPPEDPGTSTAARLPEDRTRQTAGTLSRVTLYS